jgi:hypothetical protein
VDEKELKVNINKDGKLINLLANKVFRNHDMVRGDVIITPKGGTIAITKV